MTQEGMECAVLGAAMLSEENASYLLSELDEECFLDTECKLVFLKMRELDSMGKPVNILSIRRNAVGVKDETIKKICSKTATPGEFEVFCDALIEEKTRRSLSKKVVDVLKNDSLSIQEVIDFVKNYIDEAQNGITVEEDFNRPESEIYDALTSIGKKADKVRTGFLDIDKMLSGGFSRGSLNVIAGRPSMGKSTMAMNIALNVLRERDEKGNAKKNAVAYFSLEENAKAFMQRSIMHISGKSAEMITGDQINADKAVKAADEFSAFNNRLYLEQVRRNVTTAVIRRRCTRFKKKMGRLDLIVIDYLGLLKMRSGGNISRQQAVGEVTRELKIIAGELDVPIILLCQLNRNIDSRGDGNAMLSDLRESGDIEQDADTAIFMQRKKIDEEDRGRGTPQANIVKNRDGRTGIVDLAWIPETYTFVTLYKEA